MSSKWLVALLVVLTAAVVLQGVALLARKDDAGELKAEIAALKQASDADAGTREDIQAEIKRAAQDLNGLNFEVVNQKTGALGHLRDLQKALYNRRWSVNDRIDAAAEEGRKAEGAVGVAIKAEAKLFAAVDTLKDLYGRRYDQIGKLYTASQEKRPADFAWWTSLIGVLSAGSTLAWGWVKFIRETGQKGGKAPPAEAVKA